MGNIPREVIEMAQETPFTTRAVNDAYEILGKDIELTRKTVRASLMSGIGIQPDDLAYKIKELKRL